MEEFHAYQKPGMFLLGYVLKFFGIDQNSIDPTLQYVTGFVLSWFFWLFAFKILWAITLRVTGFEQGRGRFR